MKHALLIIAAIALLSCSRRSMPIQVPVESTEKIRERLVPVAVPGDSSLLIALFACDSLNNVYLRQIAERKGKNLQSAISFDSGQLTYKNVYLRDTLYVRVNDTVKTTEVPITVEVPIKTNILYWWQVCLMTIGALFTGLYLYKIYRAIRY
jgi:hypothetical protein